MSLIPDKRIDFALGENDAEAFGDRTRRDVFVERVECELRVETAHSEWNVWCGVYPRRKPCPHDQIHLYRVSLGFGVKDDGAADGVHDAVLIQVGDKGTLLFLSTARVDVLLEREFLNRAAASKK